MINKFNAKLSLPKGVSFKNLTIKHNGVTYVPKRMAKGYGRKPQMKKA